MIADPGSSGLTLLDPDWTPALVVPSVVGGHSRPVVAPAVEEPALAPTEELPVILASETPEPTPIATEPVVETPTSESSDLEIDPVEPTLRDRGGPDGRTGPIGAAQTRVLFRWDGRGFATRTLIAESSTPAGT